MTGSGPPRETFTSRLGLLATMIGAAVGLGNVWRFPYMVGQFGGAAFVLLYLLFAVLIGIPGLMAEWSLGRHTQRGTVGAFQRAGLPGGRWLGWILFAGVSAATAYYCNAIGWVLFHGFAEIVRGAGAGGTGAELLGGAILPPETGSDLSSFLLQMLCTSMVVLAAAWVLIRGVREGIERVSRILTPLLFATLLLLILRSLTLPGAWEGVEWYILKFRIQELTSPVAMAALGQLVFSLALGGTFMVVYGSYFKADDDLAGNAAWTVFGDTAAGLLAGLAIFPAVFALGEAPGSGPGLIFITLPNVFRAIPLGWVFGALFFLSLVGVSFLSAIAAFEVLVAGLTDNSRLSRRTATWTMAGSVFLLALPPMINMEVFVPWDLTFGSGLQTVGVFAAVVTVGWAMDRSTLMAQMRPSPEEEVAPMRWHLLYLWVRWVIPTAILCVGGWWFLTEVVGR